MQNRFANRSKRDEDRTWSGEEGDWRANPYDEPYYRNRTATKDREPVRRGRNFSGRGPKGYKRSDERIREDICEALMHSAEVDATEIEVRVENGEVTLSGTVESRLMKRQVEDAAELCAGVVDVRNEIKVAPRSKEAINPIH
jgi:hypothetical protein